MGWHTLKHTKSGDKKCKEEKALESKMIKSTIDTEEEVQVCIYLLPAMGWTEMISVIYYSDDKDQISCTGCPNNTLNTVSNIVVLYHPVFTLISQIFPLWL